MTESFYNDLAPYYKYIYPDWDASVERQASAVDGVIIEYFGENVKTVLDAACGIGTQSIGLAKLGYQVSASDISIGEIEQAKMEAIRYEVTIDFKVVDMRQVWEVYQKQFDVVIACDNAVPHLLTDKDILQAFKQFHRSAKPGGGCIISVRDYSQFDIKENEKKIYPRMVHEVDNGQIIIFDVWHFYDARHYEITIYIIEDNGDSDVQVKAIRGGKYYCVEIPTLEKLFHQAGFREVNVLRDRFSIPLLVAVK